MTFPELIAFGSFTAASVTVIDLSAHFRAVTVDRAWVFARVYRKSIIRVEVYKHFNALSNLNDVYLNSIRKMVIGSGLMPLITE